MKTLVIVSTDYQSGHGGMQTALTGYIDGLDKLRINYIFVESHNEADRLSLKWLSAFIKIIKLVVQHKSSDLVFWFHCGPWLSFLRKSTLAMIPRLFGARTIAHLHSYSLKGYLESRAGDYYVKLLLLPFTDVVVLSEWWRSLLLNHGIRKVIKVSPNPVTSVLAEQAECQMELDIKKTEVQKSVKLVSMGRLIPGKGFEVVIDAMADLPEHYSLTIAGDGVLKSNLEQQVKSRGLSQRVRFAGWLSEEEKALLLRDSSIFCLPSVNDAFGMIYVEAMAFRLPIVAMNFGPVKDLIIAEVGILCDEQSAAAVKSAVEEIAAHEGKYVGGPEQVLSLYAPEKCIANITDYLH